MRKNQKIQTNIAQFVRKNKIEISSSSQTGIFRPHQWAKGSVKTVFLSTKYRVGGKVGIFWVLKCT